MSGLLNYSATPAVNDLVPMTLANDLHCVAKNDTPTHIHNLVNSQRIFKILSLPHSLENLQ